MEGISGIIITALLTILATIVGGVIVDRIRKIRPKLTYDFTEAIPIPVDDKSIGAYLISIVNPSSKLINDVSINISAGSAKIRNGGIEATKAMDYHDEEEDNSFKLNIPFLKPNDKISITAIAETKFYLPKRPDITIRSPSNFKLIDKTKITDKKPTFSLYVIPGILGGVAVSFFLFISPADLSSSFSNQSHHLSVAAEVANLADFVEVYAINSQVHYYPQGAYAYSKALACADNSDIKKYSKFLQAVIDFSDGHMADESECALFYYRGKIELLLENKDKAIELFKSAKDTDKHHYKKLLSIDPVGLNLSESDTIINQK